MNLKLTLKILVCGALLAALACGKDNPLKPGDSSASPDTSENPDTTAKPDTLPPPLPKLWNLAAGASWKYGINMNCFGDYLPRSRFVKATLEMTIKEADSLEGYQEYLLEEHLHVDRLIDNYSVLNIDSLRVEDFSDTLYNVPDTTLQRKIISARDTLWLESGDSLVYIMQNYYGANSSINFDIFYLTIYNLFYFYPLKVLLGTSKSNNTYFIYSYASGVFTAVFNASVGGLISIKGSTPIDATLGQYNNFTYKLIAYTPGPE
ncbi:MAG: hypothetical protein A3F83_12155 [Candidatus Glassbacteria bacterium RIFCSPLOWO2_12_FULL_58_11]|uniref:Uncharacterized protein n=1 Tax=Candidatus Glassbacteria bacterium RIFCSPLOWO2_12_FULL_58_11 TaxID=1817867 RepID=A0A1F5YX60_9BACT|nr:MAG: hypothetical protein A3F83_12155 [Candidatus Glassbacteria bacterium RIFCSPLOWO2_12_FULL_58_11]